MVKIVEADGRPRPGVKKFMIDTAAELSSIDISNCTPGSIAVCIENSKTYMLSGSNVWVEVNFKSGGGSGSSSLPIHICSVQEYDSTTRIPTIQSPEKNMFYLVPAADGTSPNMFMEYIYINNDWEIFGVVAIDLSGYMLKEDYEVENWTFTLENGSTVTKKVVIEL